MTSAYWNQWDKEDLDSWHGKDLVEDGFEEDLDTNERGEDKNECSCGSHCMDCLGMSWQNFM